MEQEETITSASAYTSSNKLLVCVCACGLGCSSSSVCVWVCSRLSKVERPKVKKEVPVHKPIIDCEEVSVCTRSRMCSQCNPVQTITNNLNGTSQLAITCHGDDDGGSPQQSTMEAPTRTVVKGCLLVVGVVMVHLLLGGTVVSCACSTLSNNSISMMKYTGRSQLSSTVSLFLVTHLQRLWQFDL